jgi:uncharacterized membrane protein
MASVNDTIDGRWVTAFRSVPRDVLVVLGVVVSGTFALTLASDPLVGLLVGGPLLCFLPGYALLSALFPRSDDARTQVEGRRRPVLEIGDGTLGWRERVALSFGASLALLPLLGLGLSLAGLPYRLATPVIAGLVVALTLVGAARRARIEESERFAVPIDTWVEELRSALRDRPPLDSALNTVLLLAVALTLLATVSALAVPQPGGGHTTFALLTEAEDGSYVAGGYPETVTSGEATTFVTHVTNHEGRAVEYTVVVELQRTSPDGTTVTERQELTRLSETVGAEDTWRQEHAVTPTLIGEDLRLSYQLYRDSPPTEDGRDPYRQLHVWVDVTP